MSRVRRRPLPALVAATRDATLLASLVATDAKLADQLRRAAQSVTLNIAEANRRTHRDRRNRFRIALGSAAKVAACLDVALALGYVDDSALAVVLELVDRVRAMTFRLSTR